MARSRKYKGRQEPRSAPGEQEIPDEHAALDREVAPPARPAPESAPPPESPARVVRAPAPARGAGRAYTVAYGQVWDAAVAVIQQMDRWSVVSSDPVRGEILLQIRGLVRRAPRSARVAVWLDELGLTRLEAVILDSGGAGPMNRFYRQVERRLASGR